MQGEAVDHGAEGLVWRTRQWWQPDGQGSLRGTRGRPQRAGQVLAQDGLFFVVVSELLTLLSEGAAGEGDEAPGDPLGQQRHLLVGRGWQGHEGERAGAGGSCHEQAVGQDAVGVGIAVERPTEALEERDCSGLPIGDAQMPPAVALPCEDDAEEGADHPPEERGAAGQGEAERERAGPCAIPGGAGIGASLRGRS